MSEMDLRQLTIFVKPGITYSAYETFTKKRERIQKFKETSDPTQ